MNEEEIVIKKFAKEFADWMFDYREMPLLNKAHKDSKEPPGVYIGTELIYDTERTWGG